MHDVAVEFWQPVSGPLHGWDVCGVYKVLEREAEVFLGKLRHLLQEVPEVPRFHSAPAWFRVPLPDICAVDPLAELCEAVVLLWRIKGSQYEIAHFVRLLQTSQLAGTTPTRKQYAT